MLHSFIVYWGVLYLCTYCVQQHNYCIYSIKHAITVYKIVLLILSLYMNTICKTKVLKLSTADSRIFKIPNISHCIMDRQYSLT